MTAVTLTREPRSFVPPEGFATASRLAYLDPRPLWPEPAAVQSPWRSAGFCVAAAIVLPLAALVAPVRAMARLAGQIRA